MVSKKRILLVLEHWWFWEFKRNKMLVEKGLGHNISWEDYFKHIFKKLKGGAKYGRKDNNKDDN